MEEKYKKQLGSEGEPEKDWELKERVASTEKKTYSTSKNFRGVSTRKYQMYLILTGGSSITCLEKTDVRHGTKNWMV